MSQSNREGNKEKVNVSDSSFSIILKNPKTGEIIRVNQDETKTKDELEREAKYSGKINKIWL
jgi:hypothetical protein